MKYLVLTVILGLSLYAGEMDRIEAIVQDIEKLREEHNACKKELDNQINKDSNVNDNTKLLNKEMLKNSILEAKIEMLNEKIVNYEEIIEKNEKSNNDKIKLSLSKDSEYVNLVNKYKKEIKDKDKLIKSLKNKTNDKKVENKVCEDDNPFPKLVMKEDSEEIDENVVDEIEIKKTFKASAFRLKRESDIYDSIDGKIIDKWEKRRSFTSSVMTQNWVKITGFFVNKEWQRSKKELWVKKINTIKR